MKYLINPAVALMNRLPMVYKFSLISILFLGPILVLSWLVISGLNQSVQTMTRGIEGLGELQKVEQLFIASVNYRDYQAPGLLKDEPVLLGKAGKAREQIEQLLADL
ncbi:MAG: methyl-accepting chemotaxis protein, partial [Marinobacter sp.]|nr:methyl-accepting chemotaxis protein [Marinobacter sp.]